jgi:Polyketide cyclase / dehydrase and lipid transport
LSSETIIEASADRVWEVVGHQFARIGEWATAIPASRATSDCGNTSAPVAGRVCETGVSMLPEVTETILSYDEDTKTLSYVGAGLPAFITAARNRWEVTAVGDHHARVRLDATVETRGILGRLLAVPFRVWARRSGARMLHDLKHYVEKGRPSPRKEKQLPVNT